MVPHYGADVRIPQVGGPAASLEAPLRFDPPLQRCTFVRRYKRFFADVLLPDGALLTVHCANTGAMTGCHAPDAPAWISDSRNPARTLRHTLEIVEVDGASVAVNTHRANHVVAEAVLAGTVPELGGYPALRREVAYAGRHRVDLLLSRGDARCFVEVKSVTLGAGGGLSRFPDAVSRRATEHLHALTRVVLAGDRAVLFFCALRDDTRAVAPADAVDPVYGAALRAAASAGVEILAYRCAVGPAALTLEARVPVLLDPR